MEQSLPLTATVSSQGIYRRYSILHEEETNEPLQESPVKDFFYIGKYIQRSNFLINHFDGGFAADDIPKAICILKRIEQHQQPVPAVIIIDCNIPLTEAAQLTTFLQEVERFRTIPVIMDKSKIASDYGDPALLMKIYDDVTDTRNLDNKILERISFLEKIKIRRIEIETRKRKVYKGEQRSKGVNLFRRFFDIIISSLVIVIMSPVLLLIALAIKLESRGPVLFISKWTDKKYRIFDFWKFRTMDSDGESQFDQLKQLELFNEEKSKVFFKVSKDPQITRMGNLLRKSGFDKLPQFFNVLLGDISIFDSRPLPLYEAAKQTSNEWPGRFLAPAGIGNSDIHRQNFLYDLWIIANTPPTLISNS